MEKFVYCIPHGGFHDILSQISIQLLYAEIHNRILVINTLKSSSLYDTFDTYFISRSKKIITHPSDNLLKHFDALPVVPDFLRNRVSSFNVVRNGNHVVDEVTRNKAIYLMTNSYAEELLVFEFGGGNIGKHTIALLEKLSLRERLKREINAALSPLGKDYDAIHIRNTDIQTDYLAFFKQLFPLVRGRKVLICSDDLVRRDVAHKFFVESDVMAITDIPDTHGKALHHFKDTDIYEKNKSMLTDLFGLSGAKNLFCPDPTGGARTAKKSGFALLAELLKNTPAIRDKLLSD